MVTMEFIRTNCDERTERCDVYRLKASRLVSYKQRIYIAFGKLLLDVANVILVDLQILWSLVLVRLLKVQNLVENCEQTIDTNTEKEIYRIPTTGEGFGITRSLSKCSGASKNEQILVSSVRTLLQSPKLDDGHCASSLDQKEMPSEVVQTQSHLSTWPFDYQTQWGKRLRPLTCAIKILIVNKTNLILLLLYTLCVPSVAQDVDLSSPLTGRGFRILGATAEDNSGRCVSGAGDVNGDGIDDVIVGAYGANPSSGVNAGISYVIFGHNSKEQGAATFNDIQLSGPSTPLPASVGFRILGAAANDWSGYVVSAAGDVNGDGVDDVIVGARHADTLAGSDAGISYVIFGRNLAAASATPFGDIQLPNTAMSPSVGFRILGAAANDQSGHIVGAAGDVNGDGIGDIIIGAYIADPPGGTDAGISYVVFGRNLSVLGAAPFGDIQLTTGGTALSSSVGFRILGAAAGDQNGASASGAGDINGDGIDDVLVGSYLANPSSGSSAGISYVIYGRDLAIAGSTPFGDVQLTSGVTPMPVNIGFRILGAASGDYSGLYVSAGGDVNGDGVGDVIVGALYADPPSGLNAGITYVIFGRSPAAQMANPFGDIQLTTGATAMAPSIGFRVLGAHSDDSSGVSVSAAGDMNGDGIGDILIGAWQADPFERSNAGIVYVLFGRNLADPGVDPFGDIQLTYGPTAAPSTGICIFGAAEGDRTGYVVSVGGDVNYNCATVTTNTTTNTITTTTTKLILQRALQNTITTTRQIIFL